MLKYFNLKQDIIRINKKVNGKNGSYFIGKFYCEPWIEFLFTIKENKVDVVHIYYPKFLYDTLPVKEMEKLEKRRSEHLIELINEELKD